MAALCLTRTGHGTTPLGLYRGLALKSQSSGLHPVLVRAGSAAGLAALGSPGVVSIGLDANAPTAIATRLEEYGWQRGVRHAVVIMGADPQGAWIDVADPSYGSAGRTLIRKSYAASGTEWRSCCVEPLAKAYPTVICGNPDLRSPVW
jgi:hypothetical protein